MSYLLSPDVTDPTAQITIVDQQGLPLETLPGLEFDRIEPDAEAGISRLLTVEGHQVEQYPGLHAGFSVVEGRGVYGRCVVTGPLVAFKPRPDDQPFVYSLTKLP